MATGVRTRHARSCKSRDGGGCNCTPTYQAQAYDARTGRQVWRTFPTRSAAKLWRQDAQVALRRGTMRPPTAKTIAEAAEVLIAGAHDGTILDRGGKSYKPSTARGYEQLLRSYVVPALGGWKLSQVQRRDVRTSSTTSATRACPPRPSRTSSIRCASSSGARSAGRDLDRSDRQPRPPGDPRPPRQDRTPGARPRVPRRAARLRASVLGGRTVLRTAPRRAPRPAVDQRRLRRRRDPRRALVGSGQGTGRRQDRRRPPRRPDGVRRQTRTHGA